MDPQLGHPWDTVEQHLQDVMELLDQGEDGVWFVDSLGDKPDKETLVKHRDLILSQRSQHRTTDRIALKYHWLALYHNRKTQHLPGRERDDLRVPFS